MPWLDTGIESLNPSCRCALAGYRNRVYNRLLTDVPWLVTGIESGNSRQQINPRWIQESDPQTLQTYPGWLQESSPENSRQQIHPGWIQESDPQTLLTYPGWLQELSPEIVVNRYTLARYRNRIFKLFRRTLAGYRNRVW